MAPHVAPWPEPTPLGTGDDRLDIDADLSQYARGVGLCGPERVQPDPNRVSNIAHLRVPHFRDCLGRLVDDRGLELLIGQIRCRVRKRIEGQQGRARRRKVLGKQPGVLRIGEVCQEIGCQLGVVTLSNDPYSALTHYRYVARRAGRQGNEVPLEAVSESRRRAQLGHHEADLTRGEVELLAR